MLVLEVDYAQFTARVLGWWTSAVEMLRTIRGCRRSVIPYEKQTLRAVLLSIINAGLGGTGAKAAAHCFRHHFRSIFNDWMIILHCIFVRISILTLPLGDDLSIQAN